ncbi:cilium assembly protein DZIP1L [Wyeomyia smithii]|uniref:cilium assembly protein DZIP1L n=1 Tax=Wyeomyia smithii TaxID=174621 RepID=UPI002467F93A|nr:cilium assembly protein DZIP1L [Wyeomyia smithii]
MAHKWNHNFPKIARDAGFIIREISAVHCIDWRLIASIDPYSIVGERDYEKLDEFIPHISEVPIGTLLQNRILDPAIGKYFILAQFSIQYLVFCKQFLDETIVELRNTTQDMQKENARLEKNCRKKNEEIVALHRKLQKAVNHQVVYPCSKCTKNFISFELLNAHMARKHVELSLPHNEANSANLRKLSETDSNLINTIKLELEVKQLKERLNIAERGLLDQRNCEHQCHGCSALPRKKDEAQHQKAEAVPEYHTVAIQTNLDDRKDVNEKEVQTGRPKSPRSPPSSSRNSPLPERSRPLDVISKADLETILREQREQFECWKTAERQKLAHEIDQMRQSMTEAIRELERDKPDRLAVPMAITEQQRRASFNDEVTVWKDRYHEMEKMYRDSQRQVSETVQNIESAYARRFKQFEEMMQKHEAAVKLTKDEMLPKIMVVEDKAQATVEDERLTPPLEPSVLVVEAHEDKEESDVDEVRELGSLSDETKDSESDEELKLLEEAKAKYLTKEKEKLIVQQKESPKQQEKALISPKKQIINTFKSRLKGLGIDSRTKLLPTEDLRSAAIILAERRDANKKKNRSFFITRNQLSTKVDQIAKSKIIGPQQKHDDVPVIKKRETPHPTTQAITKTRSPLSKTGRKSSVDILPSKIKIPANDFLAPPAPNTNLFKAKFIPVTTSSAPSIDQPQVQLTSDDLITVQAEINQIPSPALRETNSPKPTARSSVPRPSASEYDQHLQRLLETPIKRVTNPPPDHKQAAQLEGSDLSDFLETSPQLPKPIPKKRVIFNLEGREQGLPSPVAGPAMSSTVIKVSRAEEESDWNISSFEDEK